LRDAKTGLLNDWQALLFDKKKLYVSKKYENLEIEDRVGGGDSFSSAVVYSLLQGKDPQQTVDFAGYLNRTQLPRRAWSKGSSSADHVGVQSFLCGSSQRGHPLAYGRRPYAVEAKGIGSISCRVK